MSINHKYDFAVIFSVIKANPNGDPINGNRPRTDYDGLGEVSDVCLKRKLRNRLQDMGQEIFVQSDDNRKEGDCFQSLNERFESDPIISGAKGDKDIIVNAACNKWFDVRAFGSVFAYKAKKKSGDSDGSDAVSISIRGPVTIQSAVSLEPVDVSSQSITKSVNGETGPKGSDTMGMKHRVERGVYVAYGSINCQLAEKTGFTDEDAEQIKAALLSLFVNDESSARPAGSMWVNSVAWWKHNNKHGQYSVHDVHQSLNIEVDAETNTPVVSIKNPLEGLEPTIYSGVNL